MGLCRVLGIESRDCLYRSITTTDYIDWAKHFQGTGFETYPTRFAIAQLTHFFLQANSEKGKAPKFDELIFPRKPEPEKTEEEHNHDVFMSLMAFVE